MYLNIEPGDLEYSGPSVWPKITADRMSDIVIHRRPELTYLEAVRRKERLETDGSRRFSDLLVTVYRVRYDPEQKRLSSKSEARMKFWHFINKEDKAEDVRKFLLLLRGVFEKLMPHEPDPSLGVKILFAYEGRWTPELASIRTRWV